MLAKASKTFQKGLEEECVQGHEQKLARGQLVGGKTLVNVTC